MPPAGSSRSRRSRAPALAVGAPAETAAAPVPASEAPPRARGSPGAALLLALGLLAGLVLGGWLAGAAVEALTGGGAAPRLDAAVTRLVVERRPGWLTTAMRAVTALGDRPVLLPVVLAVGVILWVRRRDGAALGFLLTAQVGAVVLYNAVKVLVARPRPAIGPVVATATGYGFPSAHATQAAAVGGALAVLAVQLLPRPPARRCVVAAAIVLVVLVGCSRLYLGVHWVSDVVGGWVLGGLWLAGLVRTFRPGRRRIGHRPGWWRIERGESPQVGG